VWSDPYSKNARRRFQLWLSVLLQASKVFLKVQEVLKLRLDVQIRLKIIRIVTQHTEFTKTFFKVK